MNISYRRISQDDQHHGPKAQSDRIEAWAKSQNAVVEKDFFDDGVSGSVPLAERPQGAALLDTLKKRAGEKVVVVAKLDRLFRSVADAATTIDCWDKAGIKLVAVAENFDMTNVYGRAMCHLASVFAELERALIRERTRAALQAKRRRGERVGTVPYGWDAVGGKLVENPTEQATLALIKAWRHCGLPLRLIAEKLNLAAVRAKRGGRWRAQSVSSVLKRNGA